MADGLNFETNRVIGGSKKGMIPQMCFLV